MAYRLPDTLSDLIDLAIKDARGLDRELYTPDYGEWHTYSYLDESCSICLAGAVIAGSLRMSPRRNTHPDHFSHATGHCLLALEDVRMGNIGRAIARVRRGEKYTKEHEIDIQNRILHICGNSHQFFVSWKGFEDFLNWCEKVAKELRVRGY